MEYLANKIVRCEGEILIRQYRCFTAKRADFGNSGELDLFVTNRRLIFQSAGNARHCRNLTHVETAIENVEGLKFHDNQLVEKRDNRKKLIGRALIYFLLSGVTWIVSLFLKENFPVLFGWPAIVSILVCYGVVCLPFLYLLLRSVKARSTTFVVVTRNLGDFVSFTSSDRFDGNLRFSVNADAKTAQMLNELGALIRDVRQLSEAELLQKWMEAPQAPSRASRRTAKDDRGRLAAPEDAPEDQAVNVTETLS